MTKRRSANHHPETERIVQKGSSGPKMDIDIDMDMDIDM